jgi:Domain of unknown function (DUF4123)
MAGPALDLPDPANVARTLQVTLSEMPQPLFAVLDGALFDDLPSDLLGAGFSCRSLFLEHGDEEVERAGPWLFALEDVRARAHAEALAIAQPCAVFWSCAQGEMALWRHLRTLNEVLIPLESEGEGPQPDTPPGHERVMFRHWDPNVLAAVMPQLDAEQFARIFGPCAYILINAPDHGGLKRIPRPDALPPAPHGPLRLSPEQMEGLKAAMVHSSRLRIARYLKRNVPEHFSGIDDEFLWGAAVASEKTADELGIETERGRARWAYVMMLSDGKAADVKEVRGFIRSGPASPDEQVSALMKHTAAALRGGSAGVP